MSPRNVCTPFQPPLSSFVLLRNRSMFKLSVELKHKTGHGLITIVDQDPWQLKARSETQSRQNSGLERMSSTDPQGLWPQRRLRLTGSALGG